jgi:hypothetical protein
MKPNMANPRLGSMLKLPLMDGQACATRAPNPGLGGFLRKSFEAALMTR